MLDCKQRGDYHNPSNTRVVNVKRSVLVKSEEGHVYGLLHLTGSLHSQFTLAFKFDFELVSHYSESESFRLVLV